MASFEHVTVLLHESVEGLAVKPGGTYIDGTFGRGGHSRLVLEHLSNSGKLIAFDRDLQAIENANSLKDQENFEIIHSPFSAMGEILEQRGLAGQVDGILLDLGVSSPQLDEAERGFSFLRDGPLDMRMDTTQGESAADWLAYADEKDIVWVLKTYGEERFAKRIAHAIVTTRAESPLLTTAQLASLIDEAVPVKEKHKHPATRSFQAIRIYVNQELKELEMALDASLTLLKPGGRLAVISFHSLEDRIVKRFMRLHEKGPAVPKGLPMTEAELASGRKLKTVGKPIKPTTNEVEGNVRSRSSVLRIAERLG